MERAINKERDYWETRYEHGLQSGDRNHKKDWEIIERNVADLNNVFDVGCGDLMFWEGRECENYVGLDISERIINENRKKRPDWKFICAPAEFYLRGFRKNTVFCLNLLMHIMDENNFYTILDNLCRYAKEAIVISTWITNPFTKGNTDNKYQKYTPLKIDFLERRGFELYKMYNIITDTRKQIWKDAEGNTVNRPEDTVNMKEESRKGLFFFRKTRK